MPALHKPKPFRLKEWDKALIGASFTDINAWSFGYFDRPLFPWQQYFYLHPAKDKMGLAGIRTGKSYLAAIAALHFCQTHERARYLNACISAEQAKIVYNTCLELMQSTRFSHWIEGVERSPYPMIKLVNGSELWFRSVGYEAELLRGFEFDFINLDECAYITNPATVVALRGRLLGVNKVTNRPRAGWFWQLSSPKGKGTWVYDRWRLGDPSYPGADPGQYLSLRIRTYDNPLLDQADLEKIMASYTENQIRQELEGQLLDSDSTVFHYDDIMNGCSEAHLDIRDLLTAIRAWQERRERRDSRKKLTDRQVIGDIDWYELDVQPGRHYLNVWDLGKKTTEAGRNASVVMVLDIHNAPCQIIAYRYAHNLPYLSAVDYIVAWDHKYHGMGSKCRTICDSTGVGDVVVEVLTAEHDIIVDGIVISGTNKPDIINAGVMALERGRVHFPFIRRFVDQLQIYERNDRDLAQDTVMAFCLAMWRAHEISGLRLAKIHDPLRGSFQDLASIVGKDRLNFRRAPMRSPHADRYRLRRRLAH